MGLEPAVLGGHVVLGQVVLGDTWSWGDNFKGGAIPSYDTVSLMIFRAVNNTGNGGLQLVRKCGLIMMATCPRMYETMWPVLRMQSHTSARSLPPVV